MNKRSMRYSLARVVDAASKLECEDLHHKQSQLHDLDFMCPVKYELDKHIMLVEEFMLEKIKEA